MSEIGLGRGFQSSPERASSVGKIGGKISRRSRDVKIGEPLKAEEIVYVSNMISEILRFDGEADEVEIKVLSDKATSLSKMLISKEWNRVFTDILEDPKHSIEAWKKLLVGEWYVFYDIIAKGNDLDEDQEEEFKSLRNVSKAFEVATGTNVRWVAEAKKLIK